MYPSTYKWVNKVVFIYLFIFSGIRIFLLQTKNNFWDQSCQKQKKGNGDFHLQNAALKERLWIQGSRADLITKCDA